MTKRSLRDRVRAVVPRKRPRVGAFFDMDKTLIAENSGAMYMKYRYERGEVDELGAGQGARRLPSVQARRAGHPGVDAIDDAAAFRGRSRKRRSSKRRRELFDELVMPRIYPEAARADPRASGARRIEVAIVSGATRFVVEPLAEHLGIEHMFYTRLEVEDGRFTGRVIEPICFEEGKIYWLQQFIEEHGIDLARSYFYTDSVTDVPLLELVGHPVVTNPDPLLYRVAARRHWPVRFFAEPDAPDSKRASAGAADARASQSSLVIISSKTLFGRAP